MISDSAFVLQTLTRNLYYLRTIRDFAINIQLSFLVNNSEYIEAAKDFATRCEELIKILMKYANGGVSSDAIDNQIFVTDYTLDAELLTEKLFNIDIDTTLTEQEAELTPGFIENPSQEMIDELNEVNNTALMLVTNFIDFCENIASRMSNNDLFSYSYISLIEAMLIESNLFQRNLNRLISRDSLPPTFVVDYEYLFNDILQRYASFIRGLVDPKHAEVIIRSISFSNEFNLLANEYKQAIVSPEVQEELKNRSIDTVDRFRTFLLGVIEDVLDSNTYFIVEAIFLDNVLTTANYFRYALTSTS